MSDDKPTLGKGTEQGLPDQPPADHVPTDEPPPEHESHDAPPPDHAPSDQPPPDHVPPETEAAPEARGSNIVVHLTSRSAWLRVLYMVLFVAVWSISRLVVGVVMVLQVLFLLLGGKRNARLAAFGQSLATYTYELVAYLTFASEDQPFPFSDWPSNSPPPGKPDSE